jgi:hypothetical protein
MLRSLCRLALATALCGAFGAWAQQPAGGGIYTCVDAKGRKLTSDRPLLECLDREQKELNASGTVRRTLPPVLTASERAVQEERERKVSEERQRQVDERRVLKALVTRYPNPATHNEERVKALQAVQDAIASGRRRIVELQEQRARLKTETDFFKSPAQWPAKLKRQVEENEQQIAAQERFIGSQDDEKRRINARFDEELARLKMLWPQTAAAAAASAPAAR